MTEQFVSSINGYKVKDKSARESIEKLNNNIEVHAEKIENLENASVNLGFVASPEEYGAIGDGVADDTAAINAALAASGALMLKSGATYAIDGSVGVNMTSGSTLYGNGATIKIIPSSNANYVGVRAEGVERCIIENVHVLGDRNEHTGTDGEWGHGIAIGNSANVVVRDCVVSECWGDGLYVSSATDAYINNVVCDNNRRNGISMISGENVKFVDCVCSNTNGTAPQAGIDVEPNYNTDGLKNILFERCSSVNSAGAAGIFVHTKADDSNVTFRNCHSDNKLSLLALSGQNAKFNFEGCYIAGSSGSLLNTTFSVDSACATFDGCTFDGLGATVGFISQTQKLQNLTVKNTKLVNLNSGRPIVWLGDRNSCNNIILDIELINSVFTETSVPAFNANEITCFERMRTATPVALSGTDAQPRFCEMSVSSDVSKVVATITKNIPGGVKCITNTGAVAVNVAFPTNISIGGVSASNVANIPVGATLFFKYGTSGKLMGWIC